MNIDRLHENILYPVTRVRVEKVGGSGVLVYSQPDSKHSGHHLNIALTCHHVIDGAIKHREDWDPVLQQMRQKDFLEEVVVEVFDYEGSKVVSNNATRAEIIAWDQHHDLAALRLLNHRKMPYVAKLLPKDAIDGLRIGETCWVSGCSLLHDPFPSPGTLTYLRELIEQKTFLMCNAPSVFGNSGGGLFRDDGSLLGLTSRMTAIQLGFAVDIMTWMGFSTHPERLYAFFEDQELQFLYDTSDDYYLARERRERRRKNALRDVLLSVDKAPPLPSV